METTSFTLSMMYGDHHVQEVRRIIGALPGIEDIYASSAFQIVEVQFDETQVDSDTIQASLEEAGYLGELTVPEEVGSHPADQNGEKASFRHTAVFAQTGEVVSFGQEPPAQGRPLWPCPNLGVLDRET